jgi:hypothetical protein
MVSPDWEFRPVCKLHIVALLIHLTDWNFHEASAATPTTYKPIVTIGEVFEFRIITKGVWPSRFIDFGYYNLCFGENFKYTKHWHM